MPDLTVRLSVSPSAQHTHDPFAFPTEDAWLPLIGPSAYCLARQLLRAGDRTWNMAELGHTIGVGKPIIIERAIERLCMFGLAHRDDTGLYLLIAWRMPATQGGTHAAV